VVAIDTLLESLTIFDHQAPALLVYQPPDASAERLLVAWSNVHDLPPVIFATDRRALPSMRAPAVMRIAALAQPQELLARIYDLARWACGDEPRLPVRVSALGEPHWTVRLRIAGAVTIDYFDGGTHPDGYPLDA
jgi:hypothetical protein